ncbi:hypothetical protein SKAU_G00296260 [Synaphobranchus kaupii]|uniref:Granulins domain-containing protein n=1 Tax=Synaphobranchus kaupii TaxID=118154 RepID=A0A9Q1IMT3_SYNKA|nr:hypothetical protein SKAU_G00296260 [Synaphobranchus kaupii]
MRVDQQCSQSQMLQSGVLCLTLVALSSAITCPDGGTCDDGSACCQTNSGGYGCCPLARPLPMVHASSRNDGNDTTCPDGSHCPSEYSCLQSHNAYKCCPLGQGVSCSDGKHCCPEHHRCGEDGHSCIKEKALQALRDNSDVKDPQNVGETCVTCPDGEMCELYATCCQLTDGSYGCCPFFIAVCCDDDIHCCPYGTTCNMAAGDCFRRTGSVPWQEKVPALPRVLQGAALRAARPYQVRCDAKTSCPNDKTCCFMESLGRWGCCPLPKPLPMVHASSRNDGNDATCPDGSHCPSEYSCLQSHNAYKCCPLGQGVSCSDGKHCCPVHHRCGEDGHSCIKEKALQALKDNSDLKDPHTVGPNEGPNTCPDGSKCSDFTTCCWSIYGYYDCCPFDSAVCCGDHIHCCPPGTTCRAGSCFWSPTVSAPWLEMVSTLPRELRAAWLDQHRCDARTSCPNDNTCCFMKSLGRWWCCPLPKAVCCRDQKHCCPSGHTCDPSTGSCSKSISSGREDL